MRDQKKKQDWTEKLNCDAVATKVSVDSIRNSEPGMAFQELPGIEQGVGPFYPYITGSSGLV